MAKNSVITRSRLAYIDVLNVIAAFGVVALHANGCFWLGPSQGRSWITANLIETLFYWPVPVFFMISGSTLMDYRKRMNTKTYLKRRFTRTVIPFIIWSLIGLVYQALNAHMRGDQFDYSLITVISNIINTKYVKIYWFFPPLFATYLAIPTLSLLPNRETAFRYLTNLGIVFVSILPLICQLCGIVWNAALTPPPITGYIIFVVLGWILSNRDFSARERKIIYALAIVGWAVQLIGTFMLSTPDSGIDGTFKGYRNIPAVLQSVGVFVFVRYACLSKSTIVMKLKNLCGRLAPLTFGVYLMHWFVLDTVSKLGSIETTSIVWRTVGTAAVFIFCVLCTSIYKKAVSRIRSIRQYDTSKQ